MRFSKSVVIVFAAMCWVTLSCIKNPAGPDVDEVTADGAALVITYTPGDSATSVTGNVVLPSRGQRGSAISWVTNNEILITIQGIVTRPPDSTGDVMVTLTATISKGTALAVKVFILTVKDESYTGNTMNAGTMTDIDGNIYWAVRIGNQVWTVDNLRSTRYRDGTAIPHVSDSAAWMNCTAPGYCNFNYNVEPDRIRKYGMLYNWYTIDTKMLAPLGWHVPTDQEWDTLENFLISAGYNWDGTTEGNKVAKSLADKTDWFTRAGLNTGTIGNNLTMNNASGFMALPGGSRNTDGNFDFGGSGSWWTATEYNTSGAVARNLYYDYDKLFWNSNYKVCGFSVRLIKD